MEKINHFFELTRLKKPIGYMLLFWPCVWGLTVAFDFSNNVQIYLKYIFLFFSGSILMRSAGCIINDIADKDFDARVARTKKKTYCFWKGFGKTWFILFRNSLFDSFKCFITIQFIHHHFSLMFDASSIYLSLHEKIYLLAATFFGYHI